LLDCIALASLFVTALRSPRRLRGLSRPTTPSSRPPASIAGGYPRGFPARRRLKADVGPHRVKRITAPVVLIACLTGCVPVRDYESPQVTGRVLSRQTGQPIPSAEVLVSEHPEISTRTDLNGNFVLPPKIRYTWCVLIPDACLNSLVFPISETLLIRAPGYETEAVHRTLRREDAARGIQATVTLVPK